MTMPAEFLDRVLAAVDEAAFRLSHTPQDQAEEWLRRFAERVRKQWREVFAPYMSGEDVAGMVADVVARVRAKRDAIESAGAGTA
jgi:hypothetical protein